MISGLLRVASDFVELGKAGIDVKMVALSDFRPADNPDAGAPATRVSSGVYHYGGSTAHHYWFWHSYGWHAPPTTPRNWRPAPQVGPVSNGASYRPAPRQTIFSSRVVGGMSGIGKQRPTGFGRVSLRTSRSTGRTYGYGRSGSLGRSSWSSGG